MRSFLALRRAVSYDGSALRRTLLSASCLLFVSSFGCRVAKRAEVIDASVTTNAAPAPTSTPAAKEAKPACAPPDAEKIAKFDCTTSKVVKTPVPAIVDPKDTMAAFYEKVIAAARGTSKARLRVGFYGDSNLTSDFLPGHLRRVLQGRFGDGGHGYISFSRPWGSYRHEDVDSKGFWPMFKLYAPTTHIARDKQYGFANMAAESNEIGAAAWAGTTKDAKAKVGHSVKSFDIYYLKQPYGGAFDVKLDGNVVRTVKTRADEFEAGFEVIDAETDGPHEVRVEVKGNGLVRFFGTSMDREGPSIQIDSLGAGALNYERLTWVADSTRKPQWERRAYDLVVVWLGMNVMFVPPNKGYAKQFLEQLHLALPKTPVLILGPGDTVKSSESQHSDPRIVQVAKQMREVADETGDAFWDFREAMGGDASIIGFTKRGLAGEDHIHFGPEGSALMGNRLLCAMFDDLNAHLEKNPEAGCNIE